MINEKQQALEVEAKQIDDAKRVKEFLADPAVAEVLRSVERKYLADFQAADTDEKRRNVWACTQALTTFVNGLNGVLDAGKVAQHVRNTRNAADERNAARTSRR